jgi:uncharacterized protein YaiI (UPF0178 family)
MPNPIAIYIDADACPVKQEVYCIAERQLAKGLGLTVFVGSKSPIADGGSQAGYPPPCVPGNRSAA